MNKDHVDASLNKIRVIFEKASARIEALQPGDKIPATKLAEELANEFGTSGPTLYPVLKYLIDGYPGFTVSRGAHGGIRRVPITPAVVVDTASVTAPAADVAESV